MPADPEVIKKEIRRYCRYLHENGQKAVTVKNLPDMLDKLIDAVWEDNEWETNEEEY